jgi:hypothetical protein
MDILLQRWHEPLSLKGKHRMELRKVSLGPERLLGVSAMDGSKSQLFFQSLMELGN